MGAGIGIYAHRLTDRNKNGGNDQERSDHPFRVQDRLPCLEALLPQGQVARPVGPGYNVGTLPHGGVATVADGQCGRGRKIEHGTVFGSLDGRFVRGTLNNKNKQCCLLRTLYNTCQSLHVTKRQKEISFLKVSPYQQQLD